MPSANYPISTDFLGKFKSVLSRLTALEQRGTLVTQQQQFAVGAGTTTLTSPGDLTGTTPGPTATAVVGPSGLCKVEVTCLVNVPTGETAVVDLYVDGVDTVPGIIYASPGPLLLSMQGTSLLSGLAQGSHTFEMKYWMTGGASAVTFSGRFVIATP